MSPICHACKSVLFYAANRARTPNDVLYNGASLESSIQGTSVARLSILPFGKRVAGSSALFASRRFQRALSAAQESFQYVIIDTSVLQSAADAAVLSSVADAAMVVVGWDCVTPEELRVGVQQLNDAGARVIGGIRQPI